MAEPLKIKVDGVEYELPATLKLKEARIVERYCEGQLGADGYWISQICGLIHVAIKRARPDVPDQEIRERIDELNIDDLPDMTGDSNPLATMNDESQEPTGNSSGNGSAATSEPENQGNTGHLSSEQALSVLTRSEN